MRSFGLILLIMSWLLAPPARAQQRLYVDHLTIDDGLAHPEIFEVLQDKKGFMWFATQDGLSRYDGHRFKTYRNDPTTKTSLSGSAVKTVCEAGENVLWVGVASFGLNRFHTDTETAEVFRHDPADPQSLSNNSVDVVYKDRWNRLWVGTRRGINQFDAQRNVFRRFPQTYIGQGGEDRIYTILADQKESVWFGKAAGLFRLHPATGSVTAYPLTVTTGFPGRQPLVKRIYQDRSGALWICTDGDGLFRLTANGQVTAQYRHRSVDAASLSNDQVTDVREDRRGQLWVSTRNGLNVLDQKTGRLKRFYARPGDKRGLLSNLIGRIYEDREGVLWFCHPNINRYNPQRQFMEVYYPNPDNPTDKAYAGAGITEDEEGYVWLGNWHHHGLTRLNRRTGQLTQYHHDPGNPASLADETVFTMLAEPGKLWVGTNNGLSCLDKKTGRFTNYQPSPTDPGSISDHNVRYVLRDHTGRLWISTGNGLDWLDEKTGRFHHIRHDPADSGSLSGNDISLLFEDSRHTLWVGTFSDGLNAFDRTRNRFTRFAFNPADSTSQLNKSIFCINEDLNQMIWTTGPAGMSRYDPATNRFRNYMSGKGLPNTAILSVLIDRWNKLWISTYRGITRLDQRTGQFSFFTPADGLQGWEFSGYGYHQNRRTGEFFFSGMYGFNVFHPDSMSNNRYVPPIYITSLRRYITEGTHVRTIEENIVSKSGIHLPPDAGTLAFEFAALSYSKPSQNQYAYQLQGFSDQWIPLGNKPEVTLAGLASGTYTLRVKGSNGDGVWNETPAQFTMTILPPWWQTGWAWLGYTLVFMAGLLLARRALVNRERLRADLRVQHAEADSLRELDGMKSRFFANLSHEFRTPLALISGIVQKRTVLVLQSDEQRADYGLIGRQANRLLQLINQLLDLSKLEAKQLQLHPEPGDLTALLRALAGSFESLAQSKGLTYRYALPLQSLWAEFDADKVEKIVTNLLSNAIKFTQTGGQVVFTADRPETSIRFVVEDTGIGISPDHLPHIFDRFYQADPTATRHYEGVGIGLALTKELVDLLGGSITVESRLAEGSSFAVTLPVTIVSPPERISEPKSNGQAREPVITPLSERPIPKADKKHPVRLLIVEDNTDLREFIQQFLSKNYTVLEAIDGLSGLNQAVDTIPDLIISDVMMPGLDGLTLCQRLKTDERTSHIPVILLTAKADVASKLTGLGYGADDYLTKPFQLDELQARIQNLITQRQQLRERFSRQLTLKPSEVTVTSADERFLQRALSIVETQLSNPHFDVDRFSREIGLGRTQLYRKLTALTNQSPTDFIRLMRLRRAADLLRQQHGNVSEIAGQVGFNSLNYFTRCFREQFGQTPSEYAKAVGVEASAPVS